MSTILLLAVIVVLLVCSYCFLGRDLANPTLILAVPFVAAVSLGLFFYGQWEFELQWKTVALISGAIFSFFIGNLLVYAFCNYRLGLSEHKRIFFPVISQQSKRFSRILKHFKNAVSKRKIQIIICSILLILQIVTYLMVFRYILRVVNSYHGEIMVDRTNVIGVYDQLTKFSDVDTSLPTTLKLSMLFCETIGFPIIYIFIHRIIEKRNGFQWRLLLEPVSLLLLGNAILSACGLLLTGGKAGTIWFILSSLIIIYLVIANIRGQRQSALTWRKLLRIAGILAVLVVLTLLLVFVVGRNMDGYNGPLGYLLIYVAGGTKNLDIFVSTQHPSSNYWGIQTFKSIYQRIGVEIPDVGLQEYQHIGDVWFGNVYTAFADSYYDFGIWGTFFAMFILGVFFEFIFLHTYTSLKCTKVKFVGLTAVMSKNKVALSEEHDSVVKTISPRMTAFSILVYGYLIRAIFFAFFSNILFTSIFSFGFIVRCIIWLLFVLLFVSPRNDKTIADIDNR